jgi:hypothetical protein
LDFPVKRLTHKRCPFSFERGKIFDPTQKFCPAFRGVVAGHPSLKDGWVSRFLREERKAVKARKGKDKKGY